MRPDACGVAMAEYTYKAFISYSWADAKWGKWLQHAIETYRTPKALIEKHAGMREIPARLTPLFKDREEQAAGASIGALRIVASGSIAFSAKARITRCPPMLCPTTTWGPGLSARHSLNSCSKSDTQVEKSSI